MVLNIVISRTLRKILEHLPEENEVAIIGEVIPGATESLPTRDPGKGREFLHVNTFLRFPAARTEIFTRASRNANREITFEELMFPFLSPEVEEEVWSKVTRPMHEDGLTARGIARNSSTSERPAKLGKSQNPQSLTQISAQNSPENAQPAKLGINREDPFFDNLQISDGRESCNQEKLARNYMGTRAELGKAAGPPSIVKEFDNIRTLTPITSH